MPVAESKQEDAFPFVKIIKAITALVEAVIKIKTTIQLLGLALCVLLVLIAYFYTTGDRINLPAMFFASGFGGAIFVYGLSLEVIKLLEGIARAFYAFAVLFCCVGFMFYTSNLAYENWYELNSIYGASVKQFEQGRLALREKISINEKHKLNAAESENHARVQSLSSSIKKDKQLLQKINEKSEFILKDPIMMADIHEDLKKHLAKSTKYNPSLKIVDISLEKGNLSDAREDLKKLKLQTRNNLTDLDIIDAELAYLEGNSEEAIKILKKAEQQAPNIQVYLLLEHFISSLDKNGYERAIPWVKKGLKFSEKSSNRNDNHYKFYFHAKLGLLYRRLNEIDKSRKAFRSAKKALDYGEEVPRHIRAVVAEEYGGYLLSHGENQDLSEALEMHDKAIILLQKDDLESTGQYVDYLSSRAYVYRSMGLIKKAEKDYDEASKKYSKILYKLGLSEEKVPNFLILMSNAAVVKALVGDRNEAIDTADFVIKSFADPGLPQHIKFGRIRYSLGDVFAILGDWKRATELYEKSKQILSKRDNVEVLAQFRLYARLIVAKAYVDSETPLNELEAKFKEYSQIELSKKADLALKYFAFGILDFFKKNISSASENFERAAQYYGEVNYLPIEARASIWQAKSFWKLEKKKKSCNLTLKALNKIKALKTIHRTIADEVPDDIKSFCKSF